MYYRNITFALCINVLFTSVLAYANEIAEYTIGITIDTTNKPPNVTRVAPDSPAAKAGILIGDQVIAIDEITWSALFPHQFTYRLNGVKNSEVRLKIIRKSSDLNIPVKRLIRIPTEEEIKEMALFWELYNKKIADDIEREKRRKREIEEAEIRRQHWLLIQKSIKPIPEPVHDSTYEPVPKLNTEPTPKPVLEPTTVSEESTPSEPTNDSTSSTVSEYNANPNTCEPISDSKPITDVIFFPTSSPTSTPSSNFVPSWTPPN